jgi:small conductance mechanosensitive channel
MPFPDGPGWLKSQNRRVQPSAAIIALADPTKVDLSDAWKSGDRILNTAISLLPNFVIGAIVFGVFLIIASATKSAVRRFSKSHRKGQSLAILLGQIAQITVAMIGFLIALSVIAPSFQASDLIKVLGIGSVAIGFAFQNILQNFLAGILILLHEPFTLGDNISVTGLEGDVEDIQARATIITTPDGHRVFIPNAVIFTSPVIVRDPALPKTAPQPAKPEQPAATQPVPVSSH